MIMIYHKGDNAIGIVLKKGNFVKLIFALATLGGGDQGLWISASSESHLYNFGTLEKKLHQCLFSTSGATCGCVYLCTCVPAVYLCTEHEIEAIQWRHLGSVVRSARYRPLARSATYILVSDNAEFGSSS